MSLQLDPPENESVNSDIFDCITFSENTLVCKGYDEGFQKGKTIGENEGYHLGYHRGAELGAEIGFYKGFLEALVNTGDKSQVSKHSSILEKFTKLLDSCPSNNDDNFDIVEFRDSVRATYKRLCSLLKIDPLTSLGSQSTF